MAYTSAMEQGFVPRLQAMMPQPQQGPSLAGGMAGIGVGPEGGGNLMPPPQGDAGGDALGGLVRPQGAPTAQAGQLQPGTPGGTPPGSPLRHNVTPDIRGQLRQGMGVEMQPAMQAAGGAHA